MELLRTIPGLDTQPITAIAILSEIGPDMSVFPTSKHFISWAGCCPRNDRSARRTKSTRISRAGQSLKPLLVQMPMLFSDPKNIQNLKIAIVESKRIVDTRKLSLLL
ncbi:IS110 family transposase [Enterococcus avium]|uniref:IS110 family transposase n=1 Tax=Enterococcus avium TaxID=33945 RepID=UPI0021141D08|nr:IS110 family transposase [Enterococcus avium]